MGLKNRGKRERRRDYDRGALPTDYSTGLRSTGAKRRSRGIAGPIVVVCAHIAVLVAADY